MSDSLRCPQCGAGLPADSAGGLCPQCLLKMALETETRPYTERGDDTSQDDEGWQFGPYKTLRLLGRGGMGAVYLAERVDGVFRKLVAIKIVQSEAAPPEALRLFQKEREILASLDHPNIARILDGGSTEKGLPYLV